MVTRILLFLLGVLLLGESAAAATPEERYRAALAVLKQDCSDDCSFWPSENHAKAKALDALWEATQDWTLAYLGAHPKWDAEHLKTDLLNRSNYARESIAPSQMVMLAPDLYAFAAYWDQIGIVFLVAKGNGQFTIAWDIRKAETGKFSILGAWRSDTAAGNCQEPEGGWGQCGRLAGGVVALKPDARGRPRFAVRATYAQSAGVTSVQQLSIWRWNGSTAVPLFAKGYLHTIEGQAPRFEGRRITLFPKVEYKTLGAYGCCDGRPVEWTIRLNAEGVDDLGERPLFPEIDAIDAVFYRLWKHQPVDALGSPKALAAMAAIVDARRGTPSPDTVDFTTIDYLDDFSVRTSGANTTVCLALDTVTDALMFDLAKTTGGWTIAGLHTQAKVEKTEVHGNETFMRSEPCPHSGGFLPHLPPLWP